LAKDIMLAARQGGSDPDMNFRLRLTIDKARSGNMPLDSIQRAVKRGTGEGGESAIDLDEVIYEGYGPGGGAILLQAVTDNRNRTVAEVRSVFNKSGGSLGESGCVAWNFENRGIITLEIGDEARAEEIGLVAIDAEAEDVKVEDGIVEIFTTPDKLMEVQKSLEAEGIDISSSDISMVPKATIELDAKAAEQTLKLLDSLEELSDIQKAYTNADFPPEVLEAYQAAS
jgi:YebC/PmpR family DNA-binding regulatory protein